MGNPEEQQPQKRIVSQEEFERALQEDVQQGYGDRPTAEIDADGNYILIEPADIGKVSLGDIDKPSGKIDDGYGD